MVEKAKAAGYKRIIGEYLPTPKNKMVESHYTGLGFTQVEGAASTQYELKVDEYKPRENFIRTK